MAAKKKETNKETKTEAKKEPEVKKETKPLKNSGVSVKPDLKVIGGRRIDFLVVSQLAGIFCTEDEIADIMDADAEALKTNEHFISMYRKAFGEAKSRLRRLQLDFAGDGNATVLTWLGKQYLGQRDKVDVSGRSQNFDLSRLPDLYLNRIVAGEDPLKVISEFENVSAISNTGKSDN